MSAAGAGPLLTSRPTHRVRRRTVIAAAAAWPGVRQATPTVELMQAWRWWRYWFGSELTVIINTGAVGSTPPSTAPQRARAAVSG